MTAKEKKPGSLTEYERAVCYYTLPRVIHPVTYGLIAAYAVCLVEAVGALAIGLVLDHATWKKAGIYGTAGIVALGIVAFFVRALLNEIRQRKALAEARHVPADAPSDEEVLDPFGSHLLLKHPTHEWKVILLCDRRGEREAYTVESAPHHAWWKIKNAAGEEVCTLKSEHGPRSFALGSAVPSRATLLREQQPIGSIERRFGLRGGTVNVTCLTDHDERIYSIKQDGVFFGDRLVGRMYELRGAVYLDVEQAHFSEGLLAHFAITT